MSKHLENTGFTAPADRALGQERRTATLATLITSLGIAVCTLIAATAVSVGIARADAAADVIDHEGTFFAVALLLGLAFIAMGGLTLWSVPYHKARGH